MSFIYREERVALSTLDMFIAKYTACAAPSAFGSSPDRGAETLEMKSLRVIFLFSAKKNHPSLSLGIAKIGLSYILCFIPLGAGSTGYACDVHGEVYRYCLPLSLRQLPRQGRQDATDNYASLIPKA